MASSQSQSQALKRPKGTQDILPEHSPRWQHVEGSARALFQGYGYGEIRTPIMEYTPLFLRGVGETTDIVNKEMYRFEKGDRDYCLRPEGTAGVVRSFLENGLHRAPKPVRLWYTGPMFRYERPQAGRQRQFHQLGVEVFGSHHPAQDVEVMWLAMSWFDQLGLAGLSLEINDIGSAEDREQFRQALREALTNKKSDLCDTCQHRYTENPFRMLDCKNQHCQAIYSGDDIQTLLDTPWTSSDSQAHFAQVTAMLDDLDIPYQRNNRLVRGLDYYNGPVFEVTATNLGAKNTVCGGGRYDSLVETLGGPETPGVGWAVGMERLLSLLPKADNAPTEDTVYLCVDDGQHGAAFKQAVALRQQGKHVVIDTTGRKLNKQQDTAKKRGFKSILTIE